jgi:hypothetical protein
MTSLAEDSLEAFCRRYGVTFPFESERIRAGRNSEVSRLSNREGQWILKRYYQHSSDGRNRLDTEFKFLKFLRDVGVPGVALPLGMDKKLNCALYSFLPGKRPNQITSAHITQAADFVGKINLHRDSAAAITLPMASDSCSSWQDHLELTEARISRLMSTMAVTQVEVEAHAFVRESLLPVWKQLKKNLLHEMEPHQLTARLPHASRIISPSDFGFHNTLEDHGRLSFVDFEYAGLDDPAKLICDFSCQPEVAASESQCLQFSEELLVNLPQSDVIRHRVDNLLPVHRLKWCCILLNEFRVEDRMRRLHAGVKTNGLLTDQLRKARLYFNMHLAAS